MKTHYNHLLSFALYAAILSVFSSCVKEKYNDSLTEGRVVTITAQAPSDATKTTLDPDDSSRILWSVKDSLKVFYGSSGTKFISANSKPDAVCQFVSVGTIIFASNGELDEHHYLLGLYPYDESATSKDGETIEAALPTTQKAIKGTFSYFPSLGRSYDYIMPFYNICGGLRFTVTKDNLRYIVFSTNDGTPIAGRYEVAFNQDKQPRPYIKSIVDGENSIIVEGPDNGYFIPGEWYYVTMLPGTIEGGLSLTFYGEKSTGVLNSSKSITVERSKFGQISNIDAKAEFSSVELDAYGGANCYIKNQTGPCRFKVDKELISKAKTADLVWESNGTLQAQQKHSLIDYIEYEKVNADTAYIYLSIYGEIRKGNALVALYDKSGVILKSWHIWITDYSPSEDDYIMDRNLGAINATPGDPLSSGLFYQWGRPSPFMGLASFANGARAESTLAEWPTGQVSVVQQDNNTSKAARENPYLYIISPYTPFDWYCAMSNYRCDDLWIDSKRSDFDPCPYGWKVPSTSELKKLGLPDSIEFDETLHGFSHNGIWYPAAGYVNFNLNKLLSYGQSGNYWTSTIDGTNAVRMYFDSEEIDTNVSSFRAIASSVRCVRDNSPMPDPQKPVQSLTYVAQESGEHDIVEYKLGTQTIDKAFYSAKFTVAPASTAAKLSASDFKLFIDGVEGGVPGTAYAVDSVKLLSGASGLVKVFATLPYLNPASTHTFAMSVVDAKGRSYATSAYRKADVSVISLENGLAWFSLDGESEVKSPEKTIVNEEQVVDWYKLYQNTGKNNSFTQPSIKYYALISLDGKNYITIDKASQYLEYDLNFSKKLALSFKNADGSAVDAAATPVVFAPVSNGKTIVADLGYQLNSKSSNKATDVRYAMDWTGKAVQTVTLYHDNVSSAVSSSLKAESSLKISKHDMGTFAAEGNTADIYWNYLKPVTSEAKTVSYAIPSAQAGDTYDIAGVTLEQLTDYTLEDPSSAFTFTKIEKKSSSAFGFNASVTFKDSVIDTTLTLAVDNGHNFGKMTFKVFATAAPQLICEQTLEDVEVNVVDGTTRDVPFVTSGYSYKVKVKGALTDVRNLVLPSGSYTNGIDYMFGAPSVPGFNQLDEYYTALNSQIGTMTLAGGTASSMTAAYSSPSDKSTMHFGPADLTYSDTKLFTAEKKALFGEGSLAVFSMKATVKTEDVPFAIVAKKNAVNVGGGYVSEKYKVDDQALSDAFEVQWTKGDKKGQVYDGPSPLAMSFSAESDEADGAVVLPEGKVGVLPATATVDPSNVLGWGDFNGLHTKVYATLHFGKDTAKEGNTVSADYTTVKPFSSFSFADFDGSDRQYKAAYLKDVTSCFEVKDKEGNTLTLSNWRLTASSNALFDVANFDKTEVEIEWDNKTVNGKKDEELLPYFSLKISDGKLCVNVNTYLPDDKFTIVVPVKVNYYLNGFYGDDLKRDKSFDGTWTLTIGK